MTFEQQIKSPKWQKRRLEILERDKFTCQNCGDKEETLHVHHLIYIKDTLLWEYDEAHLMTLCNTCHKQWHEYSDTIKEHLTVDNKRLNEISNILYFLTYCDYEQLCDINEIVSTIVRKFIRP